MNCYAEALSKRNPAVLGEWGPKGTRIIASESYWKQPYKWDRQAEKEGVMKRVFCASLADVFEDHPDVVEARERLWEVISRTHHLNWLLLTKRPENFDKFLPWAYGPRLWLGVTVENQEMANRRIPMLLKTPAAIRFLSIEPMLGLIDLFHIKDPFSQVDGITFDSLSTKGGIGFGKGGVHINWVICGGESGTKARPMELQWGRDLLTQCQFANVPFFMKQGSQANWPDFKNFESFPEDLRVREFPK